MKRLPAHLALLAFVFAIGTAQLAGALPLTGTSKAIFYRPGLMKRAAIRNGVWGAAPDGCYMSTPLSDEIGSLWLLTGPRAEVVALQADVSQPRHKRWQLRTRRLIETDAACMRRLVGFLPAPWEARIKFRRIGGTP